MSRPRLPGQGCGDGRDRKSAHDRDRARVPLALVGVVLLLGSVAYANGVATRGPVVVDTAADDALERAEAGARPALRAAVERAAADAARAPVTTTDGARFELAAALSPDPFRNSLRLRAYLAASAALERTRVDVGGVTARASLPPIQSTEDVSRALEHVSVIPVANGSAMRVVFRDVTLTARRDGAVVTTRSERYDVVVASPVFAMHDRTQAYQARLNRGPFAGPGLGRSLTWRLWLIAQARGTGQYLGAPIGNVLASRHVELSTNAAALRAQGATFGRADPTARAAVVRATARVGAGDLLAPVVERGPEWSKAVLGRADAMTEPGPSGELAPSGGSRGESRNSRNRAALGPAELTDRNRTRSSEHESEHGGDLRPTVGLTADRAFLTLVDDRAGRVGTKGDSVDSILAGAYRAEARRTVTVLETVRGERPAVDSFEDTRTLLDERTRARTVVVSREAESADDPRVIHDETVEVVVRHVVVRRWLHVETVDSEGGPRVTRTTARWTDSYRVGVELTVAYAPSVGPDRPTDGLFERGGALDGPNLVDVPERARERLLPDGERSVERLARRAVTDGGGVRRVPVRGQPPASLRRWVAEDLATLRDRTRALDVTVSADAVATGTARPAARLAAAVDARRGALVETPARYDGAADRARVAVRAAYVDRVRALLAERARGERAGASAYRDRLTAVRGELDGRLDELARVAADATAPEPRPVDGWNRGQTVLTPRGEPGYLPVTHVDAEQVRSLPTGESTHVLATRNLNVFSVPTGDAADVVTDAVLPPKRTASLVTAASALVDADRTLAGEPDDGTELRAARDRLAPRVADGAKSVDAAARAVLRRETTVPWSQRRRVVASAATRWPHHGERVLAAADGSYAAAVTEAVVKRDPGLDALERERLEVRLRVELAVAATDESVAVPAALSAGTVDETRETRRADLKRELEAAGANATERVRDRIRRRHERTDGPDADRSPATVLAGLPVAPIPGYWYATVNVWHVEVAGVYPRFSVAARSGGPDGADAAVRYVRDGSAVELDADGDGTPERLGRSGRVAFRTWTVVVVVVPAGRTGVGDVNGDADERSSGWACRQRGTDPSATHLGTTECP